VRAGEALRDRLNVSPGVRRTAVAPPEPVAARGALAVALAASVAGLALALVLARIHAQAHAGISSFCTISETVNCDRVATSPFSVLLGLPVAVWGALWYGLAAALAAWGLAARRPHAAWPAGLLLVVGAVAVLASVALAIVSKVVIGAWCLLCAASWLASAALLAAAVRAVRPVGAGAALRADLRVLAARAGATAAVVAVALAGVAVAAAAYPRYWERSRAAPAGDGAPIVAPAGGGPVTVVVYSDYLCPYCARAHAQLRALLAGRGDVRLVHRQFPLDADCNPAVKRTIHPGACALARAGICAEAQGRLAEMDDALFAAQGQGTSPAELARRVGLDVPAFEACLAAPGTQGRLAEDIGAALQAGVKATPSYVIAGRVYSGEFPAQLLPPVSAAR
jgi:protein-disulfide isomerase